MQPINIIQKGAAMFNARTIKVVPSLISLVSRPERADSNAPAVRLHASTFLNIGIKECPKLVESDTKVTLTQIVTR